MSHLIFVPGTAAADAGADVARQTTLALARVDERLRAERSSLADAAVLTGYLRKAAACAAMNGAYRRGWRAPPPPRTTVVRDPLPPDALVEIPAIAPAAGADRRVVH